MNFCKMFRRNQIWDANFNRLQLLINLNRCYFLQCSKMYLNSIVYYLSNYSKIINARILIARMCISIDLTVKPTFVLICS